MEKINKLIEELWDNKNISDKELEAITYLLKNKDKIDINKRWNIIKTCDLLPEIEKTKELKEWLKKQECLYGLYLFNTNDNKRLKEWLKEYSSPRGLMIFNTLEGLKGK
jgi:2-hydroxy-3-keto-5-methylthiopentenyl-1-phosphate phosphatase